MDSIDEFIKDKKIDPVLAQIMMRSFDRVVPAVLAREARESNATVNVGTASALNSLNTLLTAIGRAQEL